MSDFLGTIRRYRLLQVILFILMGIFLVINPRTFFKVTIYLISGYFIFIGGMGIYQQRKLTGTLFPFISSLTVLLGFGILIFASPLIKLMNLFLGIFITLNGLGKFLEGQEIRKRIINEGTPLMIYGVFIFLLGLVITFNPFSTWLFLMKTIGIVFIVMGIFDLLGMIRSKK